MNDTTSDAETLRQTTALTLKLGKCIERQPLNVAIGASMNLLFTTVKFIPPEASDSLKQGISTSLRAMAANVSKVGDDPEDQDLKVARLSATFNECCVGENVATVVAALLHLVVLSASIHPEGIKGIAQAMHSAQVLLMEKMQ